LPQETEDYTFGDELACRRMPVEVRKRCFAPH
jgi:hypothetical protein